MKVKLIQQTKKPIEFIAQIASICYDSNPTDPLALVKKLYKNGHHSVFEHVYFTFKIEGISRACSHQLVRYRHCSFTQRSQRYCEETGFEFVLPKKAVRGFGGTMAIMQMHYNEALLAGVPAEDARYILPNACKTSLYLSCNLRELIHMANERLCTRAQWEIRELVWQMVEAVDESLHFMLVPKCEAPHLNCLEPCGGK